MCLTQLIGNHPSMKQHGDVLSTYIEDRLTSMMKPLQGYVERAHKKKELDESGGCL
jgi:hypothetical protein